MLAHGRWFSPGTPASSTAKSGRYDITEILLEVALSTINQIKSKVIASVCPSNFHFYPVCTFSIVHCIICSSSICCFWLPLWYHWTLLIYIIESILVLNIADMLMDDGRSAKINQSIIFNTHRPSYKGLCYNSILYNCIVYITI